MKNYFLLQYTIIYRTIKGWGIQYPIFIFLLCIPLFFVASELIIDKLPYGNWIYLLTLIYLLWYLGSKKRNDFLKINFQQRDYYLLRITENIIVTIPFLLIVLYHKAFLFAPLFLISAILFSFISTTSISLFVLPTPFSFSFEFIHGFRKYIIGIIGSITLIIIGITVGNFNLCIFSLFLSYLIIALFYSDKESSYFVWIYSLSSKEFLKHKTKYLVLNTTLLTLPLHIAILTGFTDKFLYNIGVFPIGLAMIIAVFLSKYAYFSASETFRKTVQSVIIALALGSIFNPFYSIILLIIIATTIRKSLKNLNLYLAC